MDMAIGLRVVRGPDWKWGNQDDGEGHVGTVAEVGRSSSSITPEKTVIVIWDSGQRTNYRVGYQNAYDLRVYDSAPVGIRHANCVCNACKKRGLVGMRWKCLTCSNVDLCSECYMLDKHSLDHTFARFDTPNGVGVEVGKRANSVKLQARGIFLNARVVRGYDWDWDAQDGGEGEIGKVVDIRGWDSESHRSVAKVSWLCGNINVYRVGHKGKVDLKYVKDANGGYYYRDHLPILGKPPDRRLAHMPIVNAAQAGSVPNPALPVPPLTVHEIFAVGDKVKVIVEDIEDLISLQHGHGGWNPKMAEFVGKIGWVHRVTDRGDIRVQFEGCAQRWTFNPMALSKLPPETTLENGAQEQQSHQNNQSMPMQADSAEDNLTECMICAEMVHPIELRPCGHRIVCQDCSVRMKKCVKCGEMLTDKLVHDANGTRSIADASFKNSPLNNKNASNQPSNQLNSCSDGNHSLSTIERLKYLESKIAEFEEISLCGICLERIKQVIFTSCGHAVCCICSESLKNCHLCRKPITQRINLY